LSVPSIKAAATALPIRAVAADRDKMARAQAVTPLIEAGRVFLPQSAPWLADFLDELAAFPTGVHDDMVDSVTQALNYLRRQAANRVQVYELQGLTFVPVNPTGPVWR
jgi:predicted phage terminase large subunit-like protein